MKKERFKLADRYPHKFSTNHIVLIAGSIVAASIGLGYLIDGEFTYDFIIFGGGTLAFYLNHNHEVEKRKRI